MLGNAKCIFINLFGNSTFTVKARQVTFTMPRSGAANKYHLISYVVLPVIKTVNEVYVHEYNAHRCSCRAVLKILLQFHAAVEAK